MKEGQSEAASSSSLGSRVPSAMEMEGGLERDC